MPDDDSNIGLFPQKINDWKLCRFENINTGSPQYMLVIGERGNKWAFYGGEEQKNDFFNIIKSIDPSSAIKIGFQFGTSNEEDNEDNKEDPPNNSAIKSSNKYTRFGLDFVYGKDDKINEYAIGLGLSTGPGYINSLENTEWGIGPHGDFDYKTFENDSVINRRGGSASSFNLSIGGHIRRPQELFIFKNLFAKAYFYKSSSASEFSMNEIDTEDESLSSTSFGTNVLFFNSSNIFNNCVLVYGVGFALSYTSEKIKNDIQGVEEEDTFSQLILGGPRLRMGLEAKLNFLQLRFGLIRSIDFYSSTTNVQEIANGTENDEIETKNSGIGRNGTYTFSSGLGIVYKNLKINLILNNEFWNSGPQMFFKDNAGNLAAAADVIFSF